MKMRRRYGLIALLILVAACAKLPTEVANYAPEILDVSALSEEITSHQEVIFYARVQDAEGDSLTGSWEINYGEKVSYTWDSLTWISPDSSSYVTLTYTVHDPTGNSDSFVYNFWVDNRAPLFLSKGISQENILNGNTVRVWASSSDPDTHAVTQYWSSPFGSLSSTLGDSVYWTVPDTTIHAFVTVRAEDEFGAFSQDTIYGNIYTEIGCPWVINYGAGEVVKLSAIGDELVRLTGFEDPQDIDIDAENRRIWVCEGIPSRLHAFDLEGNEEFVLEDLVARPTRVKCWTRTGSCYVLDADSAQVVEVDFNGIHTLSRRQGFVRPNALDVYQRDGMLWVCDEGSNILYQIRPEADDFIAEVDTADHVTRRDGYSFPVDVSVEDSTGACWLVDKEAGMLVRYEPDAMDSLVSYGFQNPVAISAAWSNGLAWILDRSVNSRALRVFYDDVQASVGDLAFPKDLAYNRLDSHCWVLDTERNRVLRIDPDGEVVGTWINFDFPTRIVINAGY